MRFFYRCPVRDRALNIRVLARAATPAARSAPAHAGALPAAPAEHRVPRAPCGRARRVCDRKLGVRLDRDSC
jgi:hypothetical protein